MLAGAVSAGAHPAPFSFVDVRLDSGGAELSVVVHAFDIAYELDLETPEDAMRTSVLTTRGDELAAILASRIRLLVDDEAVAFGAWSAPEALPDRHSVRFTTRAAADDSMGVVSVDTHLFPYDPNHQTFVNVYEDGQLSSQAILDESETRYDYFVGTTQGRLAVIAKFVPEGIHHILIGPDHILFLVGLLLLGGDLRKLVLVVTGFTVAHSLTLTLAVLGVVDPPARVVEAVIALSIVYVGVDNLMARGGKDVRVWIAVVFGFIHGFGFAGVLREMGLPREALGWSLFSFNVGVEIGQLLIVVIVASTLGAVRSRSVVAAERVAYAGSVIVIVAGAFWFVERVFLTGGIA